MKTKFIFRLSRVFWFLLKRRKKKKFFFPSVETVGRARLLLFGYGAACSHLPYAFDGTANQKFFGPHPACPSYTRHPPFQTRCRYIYIYLVNIYIYTHTHTLSCLPGVNKHFGLVICIAFVFYCRRDRELSKYPFGKLGTYWKAAVFDCRPTKIESQHLQDENVEPFVSVVRG